MSEERGGNQFGGSRKKIERERTRQTIKGDVQLHVDGAELTDRKEKKRLNRDRNIKFRQEI